MLTAERLREILAYEPETGVFTWRINAGPRGRGRPGHRAGGSRGGRGRLAIRIAGRNYASHRLAWLHVTGAWPAEHIDHINGDPSDNRFANLREATHAENMRNSKRNLRNTSGVKGVRWHKRDRRWEAYITVDGRVIYLGSSKTAEDAHAAYAAAAREFHGEFARVE
jgi:putative intracellular protease/amidase